MKKKSTRAGPRRFPHTEYSIFKIEDGIWGWWDGPYTSPKSAREAFHADYEEPDFRIVRERRTSVTAGKPPKTKEDDR